MSFKRKFKRKDGGHKQHMLLTMGQLVTGSQALQMISAQALPGRQALLVKRLVRAVSPELQAYNESRLDVFKKYGDLSEDKQQYKLRDAEREIADKELKELWEAEVELNVKPLPADVLDRIEISAELLSTLDWAIEEIT